MPTERGVVIEKPCGCVYKRFTFLPNDVLWKFCNEHREQYWERRAGMHFGDALAKIHAGLKVARKGWNGKNMWIALCVPDHTNHLTARYIYMKTADGARVVWTASQTDLLSEDWEEVIA